MIKIHPVFQELWACWNGTKHNLMLRLHYAPGSHGSHGSLKRNCCLRIQVLLRLVTFSHGLSRYLWQTVGAGSRRVHGALRLGPQSATVECTFPPDSPRSVGFSNVLIQFCHVYQVLSRFPTVERGRRVVFEPVCTHGMKKKSQSCCKHCIQNLLSENLNDDDFDFLSLQIAWHIHPVFASIRRLPTVAEWGEQYYLTFRLL